jgi:hypothetical protein
VLRNCHITSEGPNIGCGWTPEYTTHRNSWKPKDPLAAFF